MPVAARRFGTPDVAIASDWKIRALGYRVLAVVPIELYRARLAMRAFADNGRKVHFDVVKAGRGSRHCALACMHQLHT